MRRDNMLHTMGEVVLIVFSVVLGLSINTWWSGRVDQREEEVYLQALRSEFETVSAELTRAILEHRRLAADYKSLAAMLVRDGPALPADSVFAVGQALWWSGTYKPSTPTYDELAASGRLTSLQSGELRRALFEYAVALRKSEESDDYVRESMINTWEPLLAARIPMNIEKTTEGQSSLLPLMKSLRALSGDVEFRSMVTIREGFEVRRLHERERLAEAVDRVITLLEPSLDG